MKMLPLFIILVGHTTTFVYLQIKEVLKIADDISNECGYVSELLIGFIILLIIGFTIMTKYILTKLNESNKKYSSLIDATISEKEATNKKLTDALEIFKDSSSK